MKTIGRLFLCIMITMMGVTMMVSCSGASKVETYVKVLNEQLPLLSQPGAAFEGAKMEDKSIVIDVKFASSFASIGLSVNEIIEQLKQGNTNAKTIVTSAKDAEREMLKAVADEGYSMVYRFQYSDGVTFDVEIPNADLKAEFK